MLRAGRSRISAIANRGVGSRGEPPGLAFVKQSTGPLGKAEISYTSSWERTDHDKQLGAICGVLYADRIAIHGDKRARAGPIAREAYAGQLHA